MQEIKFILLQLLIFVQAAIAAFYVENSYNIFVRYPFKAFQGDKISRSGQGFATIILKI